MQLNEISFPDARPIDGYGPNFFRIGGEIVEGAVIVSPAGVGAWGGYDDIERLTDLSDVIDVLFVGTGAEIAPVPQEFRDALEARGVGVEPMSSPAACRTYNVLLAEGRRVAAALIPV